jgi:hypothetical protein
LYLHYPADDAEPVVGRMADDVVLHKKFKKHWKFEKKHEKAQKHWFGRWVVRVPVFNCSYAFSSNCLLLR